MISRWNSLAIPAGVLLAFAAGSGALASACSLDGVPSLSANGSLATPMSAKPSRAVLATWAPFTFPQTYHSGQQVRFSENLAELKRSLPAQAFGKPWQWQMGDGSVISGSSVQHSYKKAGLYRIKVLAYYSDYHLWYEFDAAMIHIR
jgi:hypothetical protein